MVKTIANVFGPAAVAVDADDQIQYFHGPINQYLELPAGEPRYEISRLIRHGLGARVMGAIRSIRAGAKEFDERI
jgi:hypothetical protein